MVTKHSAKEAETASLACITVAIYSYTPFLLDIDSHIKLGHSVDRGNIVRHHNGLLGIALGNRHIIAGEVLNSPDILKLLMVLHNIVPQADPPGSVIGNFAKVLLAEQNSNIIGNLIQNPDCLIAGKSPRTFHPSRK